MSIGAFAGGLAGGLKTGAYLRSLQDERETNKIDRELKQDQLRERREASEIIKNLQRDLLGGSAPDTGASNPVRAGVAAVPREEAAPATTTPATAVEPTASGATGGVVAPGAPGAEKGTGYSGKPPASGAVNPNDVYSYLRERGVSHAHALGMLANIQGESGFNPNASKDDEGAYGLFQHRLDRREALFRSAGSSTPTWQQQIDYALSEPDTAKYLSTQFSDPAQATESFLREWERPKYPDKDLVTRLGYLRRFDGIGDQGADTSPQQPESTTPMRDGLTRVNTKPVPTLSAEQYADIYQRYSLLAASNPTAAERLKPTLEQVRNLGLSRYMEQYEGDRGSLDYMRYYGQGQALFGQPVDPTLLFNAERMAKADERSDRAEQRADRADRRAEEMHKATMDEHELNRRLKEAEVTLKQYEPLYKLIRGDQFEAAQRLADGMGFKISGFEDGTVKLPDGTEVPTTYYWRTTEDGQQVRENTAEQARRLGFVETNLERMKLQTVKGGFNEPEKLVGVTVGADGQPVAREIQVQPAAGSDRETVATGIGAAAETPAPKASEGNWFTRMFKSDEPESAPAAEGGKEAPAETKPESAKPEEDVPQAAFVKDAPTFADPKRGVMQEQDGKAVLVYPNGMKLGTGGRKTHVVINGEVVPMQQEAEDP